MALLEREGCKGTVLDGAGRGLDLEFACDFLTPGCTGLEEPWTLLLLLLEGAGDLASWL